MPKKSISIVFKTDIINIYSTVRTTRLVGSLHYPYKGLLPVSACKRTENSDFHTTTPSSLLKQLNF